MVLELWDPLLLVVLLEPGGGYPSVEVVEVLLLLSVPGDVAVVSVPGGG